MGEAQRPVGIRSVQVLPRAGNQPTGHSCALGSQRANWNQQFAEGWLTQFDEIVRKFGVPNPEASPLRFLLLNNIMGLVESKPEIPDSDLKFVLELARKYSITQTSPDEIKDTILRVGTREAIQNWERGKLPAANYTAWSFKRRKCVGGRKALVYGFSASSVTMKEPLDRSVFR